MQMSTIDDLELSDWGELWDELPVADNLELKPAPPTGQLTLRVSQEILDTLRREARALGTPYHVLARQWILDGLRGQLDMPTDDAILLDAAVVADHQINLKLEAEALARLKKKAHERRLPYHRLARLWIRAGLERAARAQTNNPVVRRRSRLSMSDLVMLFLHRRATQDRSNGSVDDKLRLQKLLFLVTQQAGIDLRDGFYAYHFGPFSDEVEDAVGALSDAGLVVTAAASEPTAASVAEMLAMVDRRRASKVPAKRNSYQLTAKGSAVVDKLIQENDDAEALLPVIQQVRRENDALSTDEIVERVYGAYPAVTGRSRIQGEVTARREARRTRKA
jgi:predicted DNA binding CopG/RHH family protein